MKLARWQQRLSKLFGLGEDEIGGYTKHGRQRVRSKGWKKRKRALTQVRRAQSVGKGSGGKKHKSSGYKGRRNRYSGKSWR